VHCMNAKHTNTAQRAPHEGAKCRTRGNKQAAVRTQAATLRPHPSVSRLTQSCSQSTRWMAHHTLL
jgi:hypothetical protein